MMDLLEKLFGPERVAAARGAISNIWRRVFSLAGLYRPIPPGEKDIVLVEKISFRGDAPRQIVGGVKEQGRMAFRRPRPIWESADDLIFTPMGGGWIDGRFFERCSACEPGLRMLFENRTPNAFIEEAYVVQSAHRDTYGDWVSEYLCAVARDLPLDAPLLLPAKLSQKAFVQRDLDALGVAWRPISAPVKIRRAKILRQQKFFVHYSSSDDAVLRRLFPRPSVSARSGSVVYLSRLGEQSDVANRHYPNKLLEDIVISLGGRVLRTASTSSDDYASAAVDAETVIFDHGAAAFNTIGWPVRRFIEVVSDRWWNSSFLMMADAIGVRDYTIIRGDLSEDHVRRQLSLTLAGPLDGGTRN